MLRDGDCVAIFHSIHRVMKAEKVLKGQGFPILLIPAPRALHADCGLAIRYASADRKTVEEVLAAEGLMPEEIHVKQGEQYLKVG
ncbi:DUF3343 domain-containing protein [Geobacter hydrogenophilus]|uniref:Putative Se/S carrier protein-like domain-containing protein n=1 Tax=Geobacter hydrogenophilus TaxID=40983 RepID=A0A9W6FYZ2_9BACT|nr:DUF3343 domain-containing protein [Geobacter hydrogenophilus]MBT0894794.1 DUF3343 domain-containing protein [Geobacter hydrogenophilus]GLI37368.1 hypothetical protein GHYDROH2_08690 [Geobacter hydrogenophilus]